jgi:16S rRNA (cytosine967-C5)-methyltransferase
MALYQIYFLDRVPESAAVNEAVHLTKANKNTRQGTSFVNGILRTICRQKDHVSFPVREKNEIHYLSVVHSYPEWLVKKWVQEIGTDATEGLLASQNRISDINLRVNTLKMDRVRFIEQLAQEGVVGRPALFSPEGIGLKGFKGRITQLSCFHEGAFQVQDQAAQIASHLLQPKPGETVLDVCAGLGGKSTHLAQIMKNQGRIIALDNDMHRLRMLDQNARRLGIGIITPVAADASGPLSSLFRDLFDKAIVDAPCSGLGVLSRHPDGKWNRDERDIARLARVQKNILRQAVSALKRGGQLLYVTCTISKEENEEVVMELLRTNKDMTLTDLRNHAPTWAKELIDNHGFFRTFPHQHHMDGFFGALFIKRDANQIHTSEKH